MLTGRWGRVLLAPLGFCLAGCGDNLAGLLPASERPGQPHTRLASPPAAGFPAGTVVDWDGRTPALFSAVIDGASQLDSWDLGPLAAWNQLDVAVVAHGSEIAVGLFDEAGAVRWLNGHHGGRTELFRSWWSSGDIDRLTLVVLNTRMSGRLATYAVRLECAPFTHQEPAAVHPNPPQQQVVVLNFEGAGGVRIGDEPPFDVAPFDPADLDPAWAGERRRMISQVRLHIGQIYAGLAIEFHVGDAALVDAPGVTVLHFGAWHPERVGVADRVDYDNRIREEQAVIYAENFAKYAGYGYSVDDVARGLANVGAHELGHLLGLEHTAEPEDIMNVSPTVVVLLGPQYLRPLPGLDAEVFPVGLQDGAQRIYEAVGGDWAAVLEARRQAEDELNQHRRIRAAFTGVDDLTPVGYDCIAH